MLRTNIMSLPHLPERRGDEIGPGKKVEGKTIETSKPEMPDDWKEPVEYEKVKHPQPLKTTVMLNWIKDTLAGNNKVGQLLGEVKNGIIALTPWRDMEHIPKKALALFENLATGNEDKTPWALPESIRKKVRKGTSLLGFLALLYALFTGALDITDVLNALLTNLF